jgi:hypothetical protein
MTEQTQAPPLPSWAKLDHGQVVVDMDVVYPRYLKALDLAANQFSTGVVKLCITRDIAEAVNREGLQIRFKGSDQWKLENLSADQGSHDHGMKQGGKFRQRLLQQRAAQAFVAE